MTTADADAETVAMAEMSIALERGERHIKMLAEPGEISMRRAASLGELIEARITQELEGEVAAARSEAAAAAVDRMAHTVRRTLALEAKIAEGVKARYARSGGRLSLPIKGR